VSRRASIRLVAVAAAIGLDVITLGPSGGPKGLQDHDLQLFAYGDFAAAMAVQERHDDLLALPGVAGTAVGLGLDGRPVVKVYVTGAGVTGLPARLAGHAFVTEVTGAFRALGDLPAGAHGVANDPENPKKVALLPTATEEDDPNPRRSFARPVPIGVSTGQVDVTAGTIGARVTRGGDVFALSNNHVYANKNDASVGDYILQPGRVDGGQDPADAIGRLHDFERIKFCSPFPVCPSNQIDAAIAETTASQLGNSTPSNGYGTPRRGSVAPKLGMAVQKYGRTTGHTTARIGGLNAPINVGFRSGTARFTGQIVIMQEGFSAPGDSGSLIVTAGSGNSARRPVGLLFAGSETSTLANPIDLVLDRFNVEIDGN